ncbi:hypothetical protein GDO86_004873 [Hymenochirus boettgeri]|uniref:BTB domain-containing protein n=1 Tax=Hymenochirus boettgeri TaxID=247094 RepID=A0A8T2J7Q6_9PIPI|nr:hypothetical protein GDO86_004873 [Hymenochirus boettgeri]
MSSLDLVKILLGSRCYYVPREQLIAQSGFFQALFRSGMRECHGEPVTLHGLTAEGLEAVLCHITGGSLKESPGDSECGFQVISIDAVEETECRSQEDEPMGGIQSMASGHTQALVEAASYLQVQGLLSLLQSSLSLDTCLDLLEVSHLHGQWDLASAALRFMATHYHSMLQRKDFQQSPEPLQNRVLEERLRGTPALMVLSQQGPDSWVLLRYHEGGGSWQVMTGELPQSMLRVQGYGATTLHNYLFVAGGRRENGQEISAVHSYNPNNGRWTQEPSMNQKRCNFRLVAAGGALYAVGGQSLSNVECYIPKHEEWTFVAPLPETLVEFSACESQGKIYVVGGYTPRGRNWNIFRYCPSSDEWTLFDVCQQHFRKQQMVSVEDTLFLVGGGVHDTRSGQCEDSLSIRSYNTRTKGWECLKVNTSKCGLGVSCTLYNDGIYMLSRDINPNTGGRRRVFLKYCVFSESLEYVRGPPSVGNNMQLCSMYLSH